MPSTFRSALSHTSPELYWNFTPRGLSDAAFIPINSNVLLLLPLLGGVDLGGGKDHRTEELKIASRPEANNQMGNRAGIGFGSGGN